MTRTRLKTPLTYYGGKQQMLKEIHPRLPQAYTTRTESCAGGLALTFSLDPVPSEIVNDLNGEVTNFWRMLKSKYRALNKEIDKQLHSRGDYADALVIYHNPWLFEPVKRAAAFYILCHQGFASKIGTWGYDKKGKMPERIKRKKALFLDQLSARLEQVTIEETRADTCMKLHDSPDTFHNFDPPYIHSDQGHYDGYTIADFERDLKVLSGLEGRFLMSSYWSTTLQTYLDENGWWHVKIEKQLAASKSGRSRKVEVLTANYLPEGER